MELINTPQTWRTPLDLSIVRRLKNGNIPLFSFGSKYNHEVEDHYIYIDTIVQKVVFGHTYSKGHDDAVGDVLFISPIYVEP